MVRKLMFLMAFSIVGFAVVSGMDTSNMFMISAQFGLDTAFVSQIVDLVQAGVGVWTIMGMFATLNVVGIGVLFAIKAALNKMTKAVVITY